MFKPKEEGLTIDNSSRDDLMSEADKKSFVPLFNTNKIRALVLGDTGAGKTTFMINLIKSCSVPFTKLIILAPEASLMQGMYSKIAEHFNGKIDEETGETERDIVSLIPLDNFPDVEDFETDEQYLVIIDDWITVDNSVKKQIEALVTRGSRRKMHIFLLTQKYKVAVSTTIRDNCNVFILFGTTSSNIIKEVADNYFATLTKKDLETITARLKLKPYSFLIMLKGAPMSKAFSIDNEYYIPREVEEPQAQARPQIRAGIKQGLSSRLKNANKGKSNSGVREEDIDG